MPGQEHDAFPPKNRDRAAAALLSFNQGNQEERKAIARIHDLLHAEKGGVTAADDVVRIEGELRLFEEASQEAEKKVTTAVADLYELVPSTLSATSNHFATGPGSTSPSPASPSARTKGTPKGRAKKSGTGTTAKPSVRPIAKQSLHTKKTSPNNARSPRRPTNQSAANSTDFGLDFFASAATEAMGALSGAVASPATPPAALPRVKGGNRSSSPRSTVRRKKKPASPRPSA